MYPSRVEIGDLVCFNSAGMRNKSIGIVTHLYARTETGSVRGVEYYVHIYWSLPPSIPPRAEWGDPRRMGFTKNGFGSAFIEQSNTEGWYRDRGHFTVLSKK